MWEKIAIETLSDGLLHRADSIISYREWAERFCPHYLSTGWGTVHDAFSEAFDQMDSRRGRRECWVVGRGNGKSTHWSKLYPLKVICECSEPYIVLLGATDDLAKQNLAAIKAELETNETIRAEYPHVAGPGKIWREDRILTANDVMVVARGRGSKFRGTTHGRHRPTLIIGDDLEQDPESCLTDYQRQKTWDWLTKTVIPLGLNAQVNVAIIGTPQHADDILGRCEQTSGWRFRKFPAIRQWPERMDLWDEWAAEYRAETRAKNRGDIPESAEPAKRFFLDRKAEMTAGASVLWPERESIYDLMVYREQNGLRSLLTEKQCEAASLAMAEFDAEWFREECRFRVWPSITHRVVAVDPSKGKSRRADYSAIVWGGLSTDGRIYVDASVEHRDIDRICDDVLEIATLFQSRAIGIEEDTFGAIMALITRKNLDRGGDAFLGSIQRNNDNAPKVARIRRLTSLLRSGMIRFRESPGCDLLLEQLRAFPAAGHDDGPDALEMAVRLCDSVRRDSQPIPHMEEAFELV